MNWLRKSSSVPQTPREHHVGLDLNSSRILAGSFSEKRCRMLPIEPGSLSLPLVVNAEGRTPQIGSAGLNLLRRRPHLCYGGFLASLGSSKPWRSGRHSLTPDAALQLAFDAIHAAFPSESAAIAFALPAYLSTTQIERLVDVAHRANLPLEGTIAAPLAIVADGAGTILGAKLAEEEHENPVVMPIHSTLHGPGTVLLIDVDDHGLSGSLVAVEADRVRLLASAVWPRSGEKAWLSRLIDAVSDRCVRLCRRDPRDSADAEQDLYEQLLSVLDAGLTERVSLTLRTAQWYQVVVQQPEDFEDHCAHLIHTVTQDVQEFLAATRLTHPPRHLWLTHEAARLPGLAKHLHANSAVATSLVLLPREATVAAVARLVPRWLSGEMPRTHVGTELLLPGTGIVEPVSKGNVARSAPARK